MLKTGSIIGLPGKQSRATQRTRKRGQQIISPIQQSLLDSGPQLDQIRRQQYAKIMAHEQAHQSAGGHLAGGIVIEYDIQGIAIAGHVPIRLPGLDPNNPEQAASDAQLVIAAASAPGGDMSSQDSAVAAQGQAILGQAQVLIQQKLTMTRIP